MSKTKNKKNESISCADIAKFRNLDIDVVQNIFTEAIQHVLLELDPDVQPEFEWKKNDLYITNLKTVVELLL